MPVQLYEGNLSQLWVNDLMIWCNEFDRFCALCLVSLQKPRWVSVSTEYNDFLDKYHSDHTYIAWCAWVAMATEKSAPLHNNVNNRQACPTCVTIGKLLFVAWCRFVRWNLAFFWWITFIHTKSCVLSGNIEECAKLHGFTPCKQLRLSVEVSHMHRQCSYYGKNGSDSNGIGIGRCFALWGQT